MRIGLKISQKLSLVYVLMAAVLLGIVSYVCFTTHHIALFTVSVAVFGFLILVIFGYFSVGALVYNFQTLERGVEKIKKGHFDHRIEIKSGDEFERLAEGFNEMADQIQSRTKKISEDYSQLRALLENIKIGVIFTDSDLKIILANSEAKNILGKNPEEHLTLDDLKEKLKTLNFFRILNDCFSEKKVCVIKEFKIGSKHYQLFIQPTRSEGGRIRSGEKSFFGLVIIIEDVTESKNIAKMRREIISLTSHQLKTPLSIIKGNVEMLREGDFGKVNKKEKEILEEIFLSNERMIRLVNDLMDVSRINDGKLGLAPKAERLEVLLAEVVNELLPFAKEKRVELFFEKPSSLLPEVKIDQLRIKQVLMNLLDNAIKYGKVGDKGRVVVGIDRDEENKWLRVMVKDSGAGIPREEKEKIFEQFFRASNVVSLGVGGGTGLGLYIAKSIVEQSGGKIWFESEGEGKGTTFYIAFPPR